MQHVLIANRGEIAVRVIRACRDLGITSTAVYADPDFTALHVRLADHALRLPGTTPQETYLSIDAVIDAARRSGADAVHPGYGFLSENAEFADAVTDAGLVWIGPTSRNITELGDKVAARRLAADAGVPLAAGSDGAVTSAQAVAFAERHGLPIAIKAVHGGGGRGIRVARTLSEVADQFDAAVREAEAAFGRGECFVEQFLTAPRHIEVQVAVDRFGSVAVLGTRDCTVQRRHQKLVEEAPAPFLDHALEETLASAARGLCKRAGYLGVGTLEFLLSADGVLSFLEMNTRLQVEHTVTEEVTGIDLVALQLRLAMGEPLPQEIADVDVRTTGAAIEFRITAEDVGRGFLPAAGTITRFDPPLGPGVRVDSGYAAGDAVPPQFDSLIAKLIVTGADRDAVLRRARRALDELAIEGVTTSLPFHRAIVRHDAFAGGARLGVHTTWVDETPMPDIVPDSSYAGPAEYAGQQLAVLPIEVDGQRHELRLPALLFQGGVPRAEVSGGADGSGADAGAVEPGGVRAPLGGVLVAWRAEAGEAVEADTVVAVIESMKMEVPVAAGRRGVLGEPLVAAGSAVAADQQIIVVRTDSDR